MWIFSWLSRVRLAQEPHVTPPWVRRGSGSLPTIHCAYWLTKELRMSVSRQLACGRLSTAKDGCRSCAESGASNAEGCGTLQVCATLLKKATVRVGTGADGDWGDWSQRECMRPQRLQKREPVSRMSNPPGVQRRTTSVSGGRCTGKPRTTAQSRPCNV